MVVNKNKIKMKTPKINSTEPNINRKPHKRLPKILKKSIIFLKIFGKLIKKIQNINFLIQMNLRKLKLKITL